MYKRLSDYYDEIFPFEQSIAEKLEREFLPECSFLFLLSAKIPS